jgi:hypothetical protein
MRENELPNAPENVGQARGVRTGVGPEWPVLPSVSLAAVLGWLAIIWLWKPSILTLTVDDSFYALKTALNASRGRGLTFDGIHPTNGFHPLWMVLLVAIAAGFGSDMDTFVRVVLSVQLALIVIGAWQLLGPFVQKRAPTWGCVALLFACFYFMKIFVNGLESALELACMGVATARLGRLQGKPADRVRLRESLGIGLLAAATTLARLSAVAFAVPLLALHVLEDSSGRSRRSALVSGAYLLPLSIYGAYNIHSFGHLLPINAAIKGVAVWDGGASLVAALVIVGAVAALGALLVRRYTGERAGLRRLALPVVAYAAAESAYDSIVRGVLIPEIWYLVPQATLVMLVAVEVAEVLARRRSWLALAAAAYAVVVFLTWSARLRPASYSPYVAARAAGQWLRDHTDERAIVAGWDCGITAAWSHRDLVNLDGLISSWAYKEEVLDAGRVQEFIEPGGEGRVEYLAQPLPLSLFDGDGPVVFKDGVDLSGWHVLWANCYEFRSILGGGAERIVSLVLSLAKPGPRLGDFVGGKGGELCDVWE